MLEFSVTRWKLKFKPNHVAFRSKHVRMNLVNELFLSVFFLLSFSFYFICFLQFVQLLFDRVLLLETMNNWDNFFSSYFSSVKCMHMMYYKEKSMKSSPRTRLKEVLFVWLSSTRERVHSILSVCLSFWIRFNYSKWLWNAYCVLHRRRLPFMLIFIYIFSILM